MKTIFKTTYWLESGAPKMAAQKKAEMNALHEKYPDRNFELIVRVLPRRSTQSNRYYWGVVIPIVTDAMNELGNEFDHETCHEFLKLRFNPKHVLGMGGEVLETIGGSSAQLNNEEFHDEYIEKIKQFSSEYLGVSIPDPGQQSVMFATYDEVNKAIIVSK